MDSLFTRIQDELEAAGLTTALNEQIGTLTNAGGLLNALETPPSEIGQMVTSLRGLSLPQIEPLEELTADVERLGELVPTDSSELTGSLKEGLGGLLGTVQTELLDSLTGAIGVIQAIYMLLQGNSANGDDGDGSQPEVLALASGNGSFVSRAANGNPSPLVDALANINEILDVFPSPLTVESFLRWLYDLLQKLPMDLIPGSQLPVITEFQQELGTILSWQDMDGAELATALQTTLQSLAQFIEQTISTHVQQIASEIETLKDLVPLETLQTPMQGIDQGLRDLADVVESEDLSTVSQRITELNTLVSQVNTTLTSLETDLLDGQTDALVEGLADLPDILDVRMREVLAVLKPSRDFGPVEDLQGAIDELELWDQSQADEFVAEIQRLLDWLGALVDGLNLEALREPLLTVIDGAKSTVAELDNLLVELTTTVSLLFDEVEAFVDGLDVEAVSEAIEQALTDLRDLITEQINALFEPVRTALADAIDALQTATGDFNADAVIAALRDLIAGVGDIFQEGSEIANALDAAQQALDEAAQALEDLSFPPVTDAVIAEIEAVTEALRQIDVSALSAPVRVALRAALSVLPMDFQPIIDVLTEEFDDLIEAGPKLLLITIQGGPERLATTVQDLSPENLIGDQFSAPYQAFIEELATFQPSDLLSPVQEALVDLTDRLQDLNPGPLLTPLEELHGDLVTAFEGLDPQDLVQPLSDQVTSVTDLLLENVPLDEIFDQIDTVLETIQSYLSAADAFQDVLQKLVTLLEGLDSPEGQIQQLVDPVLDLVDQIPDITVLESAFTAVRDAVTAIQGSQLQSAVVTPLASLIDRLDTLNAGSLHVAVVRAYRDFPRATVEALPPSTERDQILGFLDEFDPLSADFARPFSALQTWQTQLDAGRTQLVEFFPHWDTLYHREGGPFAEFLRDGVTTAQLRDILQEDIESGFAQPLMLILKAVEGSRALLSQVTAAISNLVNDVQARLSNLLLIPEAVQAIRTAMSGPNGLIETIQNFDLSFLADEVQDVFDRVKPKLETLDPDRIRTAVEGTFNDVIGSLTLDTLLPQAEIEQLDGNYQQILDTLRGLDPEKLIVEVVQPEFETAILPLLEVLFDLSALVQALLDRLDGLESELDQELARTGDAFSRMLQAVPV